MPYNSETSEYERRSTTVIDATPDGDTVAVAIDTKLDLAADDAVTDLNHHMTNGRHYPATSSADNSRFLKQSPAGVVSWANGIPFEDGVAETELAASTGSAMVGYGSGTVKDRLDAIVASGGSALVGFLQAGTGASARTVQAKLREFVSFKDFGAVGDGMADDTDAVQKALNASLNVVGNPGDTYLVTSISMEAGQRLDLRGATIKQATANASLVVASVDGATLCNGVIDGNKAAQTTENFGFRSVGGSNLTLDRVTIKDCRAGSAKISGAQNVTLRGCVFQNGGAETSTSRNEVGIASCENVKVIDNIFIGSAITGGNNVGLIVDTSGGDCIIAGNAFSNYESEVIQIVRYNSGSEDTGGNRIKRALIDGNIIDGSSGKAAVGIHVGENCDHVVVTSNIVFGAISGIKVGQWVSDVLVDGNMCYENTADGINILGSAYSEVVVSNNTCTRNATNGITVVGTSGDPIKSIVINGNVCNDNSQGGGALTGGIKIDCDIQKAVIANNVCSDSQTVSTQRYGILLVTGTFVDAIIASNMLTGNTVASGYVAIPRHSFYSIGNIEGAAPTLYNVTFNYGPIASGGASIVWTSPNSSYDDKAMNVVLKTTNPGGSAGDSGYVTTCHGKSAAGRNTVVLHNPSSNAANGIGYIYFTGRSA